MAWSTPKTDWTSADAIGSGDLNRIESNIDFTADNPSGTLLRIGPSSSAVLVNTDSDDLSGAKLQVSGKASIKQTTNNSEMLTIGGLDTLRKLSITSFSNDRAGSNFNALYDFNVSSSVGQFAFSNTSGTQLFIDTDKVLINTESDDGSGAKLQVNGSQTISGKLLVGVTSGDKFTVEENADGLVAGYVRNIHATGKGAIIKGGSSLTNYNLQLRSYDNTTLFTVSGTGQTIIGESDDGSGAKLQVSGGINAQVTGGSAQIRAKTVTSGIASLKVEDASGGAILLRGDANPSYFNTGSSLLIGSASADGSGAKLQVGGSISVSDDVLVSHDLKPIGKTNITIDGGVDVTGDILPKNDASDRSTILLGSGMSQVIPRGVYFVKLQTGSSAYTRIQTSDDGGSSWLEFVTGNTLSTISQQSCFLMSDGVNFRILSVGGTTTTIYHKF